MVSLLTPTLPGLALPVLPSQEVETTFPKAITSERKGQLSLVTSGMALPCVTGLKEYGVGVLSFAQTTLW